MEKILLALNHRANERLLEECLKNRYAPFSPAGPLEKALLEEDFSLGIVDGPVLQSLRAVVQKRREQEAPPFSPLCSSLPGKTLAWRVIFCGLW